MTRRSARRSRLGIIAIGTLAAATGRAESLPGTGFDVERYAVALRPDLATGAVAGSETVTLRATAAGVQRLVFSANALRIDDAAIGGRSIEVRSEASGITFLLPRPLRRGERVTVRFRMAGRPARGVATTPSGLYTSYFACDWMVCLQDAPGDKAALLLDLYVPPGLQSVGVGRQDRRVPRMGDVERHRWRSTRPYSAYLFGFAVGRFPEHRLRSAAGELVFLDATGTGADLGRSFAESPAIAAFMAARAGTALPDRRYTQLLVPGEEAQEAADFGLIGRATLDGDNADPPSSWIVAHEMAHQWWGNAVTCASWRDFWLNEGIATFMVAAWKEQRVGAAAYRQELDGARRRVARARNAGFDKPLAWDGRYPSLGLRRAVQYSKGALFLAELRAGLGDRAFWAGLRRFTRNHAGGTVTSRDFQRVMQSVSREDLSPLFAQWVYGSPTATGTEPGRP